MAAVLSFKDLAPITPRRGQPEPLACWVEEYPTMVMHVSAITRVWSPSDAMRCKLCHGECGAVPVGDAMVCTTIANRKVSAEEAPLYTRPRFS